MTATPGPMAPEPADLDLAQSETVAPAAFGNDAVDDHVTIENKGPGDATDVVLHDVVPPGATIESATVDQGSCTVSATEVTCVVPRLDAGGSAEADVVIMEPAGDAAAGSINDGEHQRGAVRPDAGQRQRRGHGPDAAPRRAPWRISASRTARARRGTRLAGP